MISWVATPYVDLQGVLDGLRSNAPSFSPSELEGIGAVMSAIISLLLLFVYYQQTKLKKIEQRPIVHADAFRYDRGNDIEVDLRNYGRGSATRLTARSKITPVERSLLSGAESWEDLKWRMKFGRLSKYRITRSAIAAGSLRGRVSNLPLIRRIKKWHVSRKFVENRVTAKNTTSQLDHSPNSTQDGSDEEDTTTDAPSRGGEWVRVYGNRIGPGEEKNYTITLALEVPENGTNVGSETTLLQFNSAVDRLAASELNSEHTDREDSDDDSESGEPENEGDESEDAQENTNDVDLYRLRTEIKYVAQTGTAGTERVLDYVIPVHSDVRLQDALEIGMPIEDCAKEYDYLQQSIDMNLVD